MVPSTSPDTGVGGLDEHGAQVRPAVCAGTEASSSGSDSDHVGRGDGSGLGSARSTTPAPARWLESARHAILACAALIALQCAYRVEHVCGLVTSRCSGVS